MYVKQHCLQWYKVNLRTLAIADSNTLIPWLHQWSVCLSRFTGYGWLATRYTTADSALSTWEVWVRSCNKWCCTDVIVLPCAWWAECHNWTRTDHVTNTNMKIAKCAPHQSLASLPISRWNRPIRSNFHPSTTRSASVYTNTMSDRLTVTGTKMKFCSMTWHWGFYVFARLFAGHVVRII